MNTFCSQCYSSIVTSKRSVDVGEGGRGRGGADVLALFGMPHQRQAAPPAPTALMPVQTDCIQDMGHERGIEAALLAAISVK